MVMDVWMGEIYVVVYCFEGGCWIIELEFVLYVFVMLWVYWGMFLVFVGFVLWVFEG